MVRCGAALVRAGLPRLDATDDAETRGLRRAGLVPPRLRCAPLSLPPVFVSLPSPVFLWTSNGRSSPSPRCQISRTSPASRPLSILSCTSCSPALLLRHLLIPHLFPSRSHSRPCSLTISTRSRFSTSCPLHPRPSPPSSCLQPRGIASSPPSLILLPSFVAFSIASRISSLSFDANSRV